MERFKKYINTILHWIGSDGLLHFCVSALIMVALGWVRPLWVALLVVLAIGLAKEVYDHFKDKSTHDHIHDIVCDIVGVLFALLFIWLNSLA